MCVCVFFLFLVKHQVKVKESAGEEMPMPRNVVMILIIHVGEHGSQNTIVHT